MTTKEDIIAYVHRLCLCGHKRSEHAHFRKATFDDQHRITNLGERAVVSCVLCGCEHYTDEIERDLMGNPLEVFERFGLAFDDVT